MLKFKFNPGDVVKIGDVYPITLPVAIKTDNGFKARIDLGPSIVNEHIETQKLFIYLAGTPVYGLVLCYEPNNTNSAYLDHVQDYLGQDYPQKDLKLFVMISLNGLPELVRVEESAEYLSLVRK